ncbi:MAG: TatD family hydrolase [Elusimicrobia bacterium]|nr:TatD family hydrolase [Elusimicrobiota bacterium]
MLIDTHAHLNDLKFDPDRDAVIRNAFQVGVQKIIEIADGYQEWINALTLCRKYPGHLFCAWGFHPHHALLWQDSFVEILRKNLDSPLIVAIGEIGIDYAKSEAPPHIQQRTLRKMIELANDMSKPLVLHCREGQPPTKAHEDLFHLLEKYWKPKFVNKRLHGVLHCFSGTTVEAARAISLKLALGVDGPVTYPKNDRLREALFSAGLDKIVLETDSPYLPPQSIRGQRNDPSRIREIAQALAALFKISPEEVASQTTKNAQELLELPR